MERRTGGLPSAAPHVFVPDAKLLADFIHFSQRQYDCLDYDPFHPLVIDIGRGLSTEAGLWWSTLYMAFYNIGSAYAVLKASDPWGKLPKWAGLLPVGLQRRNLRGGKVVAHLEDFTRLARKHGKAYDFLTEGFTGRPKGDWIKLRENVAKPWGNGRWSVYTTSELYQKANKLLVWPCDIMNDDSTGPAAGLSKLYCLSGKDQEDVGLLDALADRLFVLARAGLNTSIPYLPHRHYDYAMMESQLCDFNSLMKGRYYIGRDIDRDWERILQTEETLKRHKISMSLRDVWESRERVFDRRYLSEFQSWNGIQEYALTYYKRTGKIMDHKEIRKSEGFFLDDYS